MSITVTKVTGPTLVQSGNTTFYKYEPFEYTFTDGANTLTVSTQNFATYFSGSGSTTVTFSAPIKGFTTTGSQSGDTFTITSSGGTTSTFTIFVLSGRFQGSNAITAYIGETLSSTYTSVPSLTDAYPSPTLPTGLSFSLNTSNTLVVSGTPTAISPVTSYLFYGSNSTNGYTVSELVSIQICNARVTVSPSTPSTQGLSVNSPFAGLTLTNTTPSQNPLSFAGSLPIGLSWTPATGLSSTISGTPGIPQSGSFTALCTVIDTVTKASTIVTIPFVYNEVVQFTYPTQTNWTVWSNIPIETTYGSGIQLIATTNYGSGTGMTYTSPGLTSTTTPALGNTGLITGIVPASGSFVFAGTNSTPTAGTTTIAFNVSQAYFTVSGAPSSVSGIVGKAITPFSFSVSTDSYKNPAIVRSIANMPNGITVGGSGQLFAISGIPTTVGTTTGILTVSDSNSKVTPLPIPITFTISNDTFSFTPSSQTFAFAQNIQITPIQITAVATYGIPVTFYSQSFLPVGLNISSTGLIQGTPLVSGSGQFTVTATNGYTSAFNTYYYTIAVDTMICYSSAGNSFPLTVNKSVSIPITTVLRSGALVSQLSPGYLYGLSLTPTLLSGIFGTGVYPDVVIQSNTITVIGSNAAGSVSSTFFQLGGTTLQTKYTGIAIGSNIYYSNSSFNTLVRARLGGGYLSVNPPTITDFQSGIPGAPAFMIANKTNGTFYSSDGGQTYVQSQQIENGSIHQVAHAVSSWYGICTSPNDGTCQILWGPGTTWTINSFNYHAPPMPRIDGGLVLRAVKTPQAFSGGYLSRAISSATSDGTTITYTLAEATGIDANTSGIFSFSGFSNSGYNLEAVAGTVVGPFTITVASTSKIPTETRTTLSPGSVILYSISMTYSVQSASYDGVGTITYSVPVPAGENKYALWTFTGFTTPGFNLAQVPAALISGSITVSKTVQGLPVIEYSSSATVTRLLTNNQNLIFGGRSPAIQYAPVSEDSQEWSGDNISNTTPSGVLLEELRDLSTNVPTMIIAAGGHRSDNRPSTVYTTLQYSTDYGVTWKSSTNDFSWYASSVVWGGHTNTTEGTTRTWIALGYNNTGIPGIKCSIDGINWTDVNIDVSTAMVLGPLQFDGTNWNLIVDSQLYTHDANSATLALADRWTITNNGGITAICSTPYYTGTVSGLTIQIGTTSTGPTFSSPTVTKYIGYQYIPITTIVFDTLSSGTSFFLASTLPAGLTWTPAILNSSLNGNIYSTITGQPVVLGTSIIDVYAQNTTGISKITITIITQPIPLKTPDTTPSGYTNFIKQKVIADSAVSSINNKALVSPVGTFLAKDPQPETTAPATCCPITQ